MKQMETTLNVERRPTRDTETHRTTRWLTVFFFSPHLSQFCSWRTGNPVMPRDAKGAKSKARHLWRFQREKYTWNWEGKQEPERGVHRRGRACPVFSLPPPTQHTRSSPRDLDSSSPCPFPHQHSPITTCLDRATGNEGCKKWQEHGRRVRCWVSFLAASKSSKCPGRRGREKGAVHGVEVQTSADFTGLIATYKFTTAFNEMEKCYERQENVESTGRRRIQWLAKLQRNASKTAKVSVW